MSKRYFGKLDMEFSNKQNSNFNRVIILYVYRPHYTQYRNVNIITS